jgi:hypothetical protein
MTGLRYSACTINDVIDFAPRTISQGNAALPTLDFCNWNLAICAGNVIQTISPNGALLNVA